MPNSQPSDNVIRKIIQWANAHDAIRTVLLTSNRAIPGARTDALSDYDVVLVVHDIRPFVDDHTWLDDFGEVLVGYWDEIYLDKNFNLEVCGNVIQYLDGLKIDFNLWPVELVHKMVTSHTLTTELDAGYQVLLDKDQLTEGMLPPSGKGYIPEPPTREQYLLSINNFLSDAPYVAKFLWRDEVIPASWCLEDMKLLHLLPMLGWWVEMQHHWSVKLGVIGRGLKRYLSPELWEAVEQTYAGSSVDDNWLALEHTLVLMKQVAIQVGEKLGYTYPEQMHENVVTYVEKIRHMPRQE